MFKVGIAIVFLIFTAQVTSFRIFGGRVAKSGEYPMMVSLREKTNGGHICGGILIAPRAVLTAAHCVRRCLKEAPSICAQQYSVMLGDINRNVKDSSPTTRQIIRLRTIILHKNFTTATLQNDIAYIELIHDAKFSRNVDIAALAPQRPDVGQQCVVTGWGATEEGKSSMVLLVTLVHIINDEVCIKRLKKFRPNHMICAGDLSGCNDSCQGDSGGPLICGAKEIAGIVSFGIGCALEEYASAYTDVRAYMGWITERLARSQTSIKLQPKLYLVVWLRMVLMHFILSVLNWVYKL